MIEEIKQNKLMSNKHKKICTTLSYIERRLILASTVTERVSISLFASLVRIPVGIATSAVGLIVYAITAGKKKYKSIIKKKKKKHDKIVLLAKTELNSMKALISKDFIEPYISHDGLVFINNALKEHDNKKEEI